MTTSVTRPTSAFAPGTLLRGKYRVTRMLGHGGMGVVVEAMHLDLERRVAIKVLHADLQTNAEFVERFVREGRAASRIEGDHIARVFDVDRLEDGTPFLVMEYLEGTDLSYVRRNQTPLPVRQAIDYLLQACRGVALAHSAGVIHRDVKPANLFVIRAPDGSDRVKVLDFGISKLTGPGGSEPSMTRTTIVMGSVEYMSPEQMLSTRDVDARTDVWALGVVLFELLTAAPPFHGENATQICAQVMSQPAVLPRSLRPDLPEELEAIILRCLAKERDRRFATVEELADGLRVLLASPDLGHDEAPVHPPAPQVHEVAAPSPPTALLPEAQRLRDSANTTDRGKSGTRISLGVPLATGGSSTIVGVASDPIPAPPRHKSFAWLYATLAIGSVAALGGLWVAAQPSEPAAPGAAATQPPGLGEPSAAEPQQAQAPTLGDAPTVEPAGPEPSAIPSSSSSAAAGRAAPGAAGRPTPRAGKPMASTMAEPSPGPTARPQATTLKPSGID